MKPILILTLLVLCAGLILVACCTTAPAQTPEAQGDALVTQGAHAFNQSNYHAAATYFLLAQQNYTAAGDTTLALDARDRRTVSRMMTMEFPYNRSTVERLVAAAVPDATDAERERLLNDRAVTLTSDGEVWYFTSTARNIQLHSPALMQRSTAAANHTPLYDELTPLIFARQENGTGPYGTPVQYEGRGAFSIPRDKLPATGTLKLWIPLPIEEGAQTNVTIISVEPARYVKSSTGTNADIGLTYLEIPLFEVTDPFVNVTVRFRFTQAEQRFAIDPAKVLPYNTSSPEYRKYTAPGRNIALTPAMVAKAQEIVGNETNPYLKAQKIYWYIMDTLPYSKVPHTWLDAAGTPESVYVLSTGIGDCGSQSMYFAALCRAVGIPARTPGGMQMIAGAAGSHFWAEYYLEGYGWIPVDVTAAEGADWSYNATPDERHRFREYYFGSLDPYRYVIQKDADIPLVPVPEDSTSSDLSLQEPRGVCDTCMENPTLLFPDASAWTVTFTKS